jgi:hypothetical protein
MGSTGRQPDQPVPKEIISVQYLTRPDCFSDLIILKLGENLSRFGASFGMGLPIAISRQAPNQYTLINVAIEYSKRGNNENLLKESMFRFSLGFSLSDLWFGKHKYD